MRAIAVVSIILYHAQLLFFGRDWFEGGFIGVDIFFVISGYLITRIILFELQSKGSFSFLNFYERRARRILPMLFVVIFVSIPYAWQRLLPLDFVEYAESILASLFFSSNFLFYFSTTEYGADNSLLMPFLHTWSLSIEEQFYLVFPILAIFVFKFFRKHFLSILVGLSLLSLQFADLMEVRNSDLNFYLPFSRFWELAVGSILAYRELNFKSSKGGVIGKQMLPILGVCLVAYSILFFDSETPHPSFHTLIPILGVALIIGFASKDELIGNLLGSRPLVYIGLVSYSIYLWHFPIFSFSRIALNFSSNTDKFFLIALTFILSFFSYFFIEGYFRDRKKVNNRIFLSFIMISFVGLGSSMFLVIKKGGFEERLDKIYSSEARSIDKNIPFLTPFIEVPNVSTEKKRVILLGDSYTYNWGVFGHMISDEYDVVNLQYMGCRLGMSKEKGLVLKKVNRFNWKKRCEAVINFFSDHKQLKNVEAVILTAHLPFSYRPNQTFRSDLIRLIKKESPNVNIFIMGNYFQLDTTVIDSCLNLMFQTGSSDAEICIDKSTRYDPQTELREMKSGLHNADKLDYKIVSVFDVMRNNDGTYPYENKGIPFMLDWCHLTKGFVKFFTTKLSNYDGKDEAVLGLKKLLKGQ